MTDSIGFYGDGSQSAPTSAYVQDLYNRAAEWGPCLNDVSQVVSAFASYDLPLAEAEFGKDMDKSKRLCRRLAGEWHSQLPWRFPVTITGSDNSGTNSRGARADCLATPVIYGEQNARRRISVV